jgi:mono/diheme cytochrome c family protein
MMTLRSHTAVMALLAVLLAPLAACSPGSGRSGAADSGRAAGSQSRSAAADRGSAVERGRYLFEFGGCNDCHSPKVFTAAGPTPDTTRLLSGHPGDAKLPPIPAGALGPDRWGALASPDLTAWAGPWGVSFTANLTPDPTGLGGWTVEQFIRTMRTGKHWGTGRAILPPMPWYDVGKLTDDDLRAVFAYLRSLKPVANRVPTPVPPARAAAR